MKYSLLIMLAFVYINNKDSCSNEDNSNKVPMGNSKIKIRVNSQMFRATLLDNKSVKALKEMLPLTMKMTELNGNEKYGELPNSLPVNPYNPKMINNGDLMLYGSKTLVLFYKTFSTPYSYTKLGYMDEIKDLTTALGPGDVTITIELE